MSAGPERPKRFAALRRVLKLWLLMFLALAIFAGILYRTWVGTQVDAVVVFSGATHVPVLTWAIEVLTSDPKLEEIELAGSPTTLAHPPGQGPWPGVVFLNGATREGRFHPRVRGVARGLARAGYIVFVPDLPGVREGEITTRTIDGAVDAVREAQQRPDVRHGRVALYGVSTGATIALLVAEDPRTAGGVSIVGGIAPYTDLRDVILLASTGYHRDRGKLELYNPEPYVSLAVARSLAGSLPRGRDRRILLGRLLRVPDKQDDPLAVLRERWARRLGPEARGLVRLLVNTDPGRFPMLYASLPPRLKEAARRLSPIDGTADLRAPVEIATAPHDKYFPTSESRELQQRVPHVHLTVTRTLAHAIPEPSPSALGDLAAFDGFLVRSLRAAN